MKKLPIGGPMIGMTEMASPTSLITPAVVSRKPQTSSAPIWTVTFASVPIGPRVVELALELGAVTLAPPGVVEPPPGLTAAAGLALLGGVLESELPEPELPEPELPDELVLPGLLGWLELWLRPADPPTSPESFLGAELPSSRGIGAKPGAA